jgi:hypothetical protein
MTLGQLYLDTTYVYINKKFVPLPKVGSKPQIIIRIEPASSKTSIYLAIFYDELYSSVVLFIIDHHPLHPHHSY